MEKAKIRNVTSFFRTEEVKENGMVEGIEKVEGIVKVEGIEK